MGLLGVHLDSSDRVPVTPGKAFEGHSDISSTRKPYISTSVLPDKAEALIPFAVLHLLAHLGTNTTSPALPERGGQGVVCP
jgi:hypothetical protein